MAAEATSSSSTGTAAVETGAASSSASGSVFGPVDKTSAVAQLVGLLEETRRKDDNSFERQLARLKKEKEAKMKEVKKSLYEAKKVKQRAQRARKKIGKTSTEDLLEVLRFRALRASGTQNPATTPTPAASDAAEDAVEDSE